MRSRIIAFPKDGNIYTLLLYAEVVRSGVPVIEGVWSNRWLWRNLRADDLIHIHWPSFGYFEPGSRLRTGIRLAKLAAMLAYAKSRGVPIVWTAHNLYPHEGGRDLLAHRLGRRITLAFVDRVCVHGPSAGKIVAKEFGLPQARLLMSHHGHWIDCYPNTISTDESRARLGVAANEFLYLHVGRCKPYKGLEQLIDAFAAVAPPAKLLIAGKFSSAAYLEKITSMAHATPGVQVLPDSIPDDALQVYLNAADCVVLPYRDVLTSGTAVLAMSFGRPVIAPDLGAMRDHVSPDCGILYDAANPSGLAESLRDIRLRRFDATLIKEHVRRFGWSQPASLLLSVP